MGHKKHTSAAGFLRRGTALVLAFLLFAGLTAALLALGARMGILNPATVESAAAKSQYTLLAYEKFQDDLEQLLRDRAMPQGLADAALGDAWGERTFFADNGNAMEKSLQGILVQPDTAPGAMALRQEILDWLTAQKIPQTPELAASVDETAALAAGYYREGAAFEFGLAWREMRVSLLPLSKALLPLGGLLALACFGAMALILRNTRQSALHLAWALSASGLALLAAGAWLWKTSGREALTQSFAYSQFTGQYTMDCLIPFLGLGALTLALAAAAGLLVRRAAKEG